MEENSNFIKTIMKKDLESGKHNEIITRFPPEPNGYFHIGHVRAIATNFELAKHFNGKTNLRFDDTNPVKEETEFVEAIKRDISWLGYKWDKELYASDYFEEFYNRAVVLINKGLAYVDHSTSDEMREQKGTLTEAGKNSKYRDRTVEENLDLFKRMRAGEFDEGECVLRAKIDMASSNMFLRDPVIYRIINADHHHVGGNWCIYPMYDFAHPLEDAIEGITHSLCSIEFEEHRPLYDWVVAETEMEKVPRQIEFGRLAITNTILSKRYLRELVESNVVDGWDDPRMPTIAGLRRRGFTPESIKNFVIGTGLSKNNTSVDYRMLESYLRDDLKLKTSRKMVVLDPLKVVIENYPEGEVEYLLAENNNENEDLGEREIPFSREIFIEKDDFVEVKPNKKWKRLALGLEVRLMHAYFIKCTNVIKDESGNIIELRATYDKETKSGSGFNERKPNGTIHWVDANVNVPVKISVFDSLLLEGEEYDDLPLIERINKDSKNSLDSFGEVSLKDVKPNDKFQFIRHGYFNVDNLDGGININQIVALKTSFK